MQACEGVLLFPGIEVSDLLADFWNKIEKYSSIQSSLRTTKLHLIQVVTQSQEHKFSSRKFCAQNTTDSTHFFIQPPPGEIITFFSFSYFLDLHI